MSGWNSDEIAQVWLRTAQTRGQMMAAATERMFVRAGVREGARVLDLGTGTGDTALLLSARVGAGGTVVATDFSAAMVEAATSAVRDANLSNVSLRQMDAQHIDVAPASFDAVVARCVLMFVPDLSAVLRGVRRALRSGGRFAFISWGPLAENPFNHIVIEAARSRGRMPAHTPELVRAFSLSDPDALTRALTEAGFSDVTIERVPAVRHFASAAEARQHLDEMPLYRELLADLTAGPEREGAFADIEAQYQAFERDGGCDFPTVTLVTSGAAP